MSLDILFLTPSGEHLPSVRFRVLPFVERWRKEGLAADWLRIPKAIQRRLALFWTMPRARAIVVQQKLLSGLELALLRRKCDRLAYDFDDALWTVPSNIPSGEKRDRKAARAARRFAGQCRRADVLIAGNAYLADKAREYADNVHVVPTGLDVTRYTPDRRAEHPVPVVGWMGTHGNQFFLPQVLDVLAPHLSRFLFLVVSDQPYGGPQADHVSFERWDAEREPDQLRSMDIGLMPLTDDEYTRGKCGFKMLQYMACGAAPVASAVGVNAEILTHGENGLLVRTPEEWGAQVLRLVDDPRLRQRLARNARQTVERDFGLDVVADRLRTALGV